jgi:hypothetical protein
MLKTWKIAKTPFILMKPVIFDFYAGKPFVKSFLEDIHQVAIFFEDKGYRLPVVRGAFDNYMDQKIRTCV